MERMRRRLLLLALTIPLAAQQLPPIGERIEVSIVNVEAVVTDRDGRPVRGLTAADFEIFSGGVSQPITNFSEYRSDGASKGVEAAADDRRTLVLFIERQRLGAYPRIFDALEQLLRSTIRPGDAASIIVWDDSIATLTTAQKYTDDLRLLEGALDKLRRGGVRVASDRMTTSREPELRASLRDRASSLRANPAATDPWSLARLALRKMTLKVSAVRGVIDAMGAIEGRKAMVLAVDRFSLVAGAEYFHMTGHQGLPGEVRGAFDTTELRTSLVNAANASGVTLYPVNPKGLRGAAMGSAADADPVTPEMKFIPYLVLENETPALTDAAFKTGGAASWSQKDIAAFLPRIAADFSDYYSLAFRATGHGVDRVHDVSVRVKNREYVVRARTQYAEKSDPTRIRDRVTSVLMGTAVDGSTIPVTVTFGPKQRKGRGTISISAGSFSLFIAQRTLLGDISEVTRRTQTFDAAPRSPELTYRFELVANREAERLSIGVLDDATGRFGLSVVELPR
jgi:VWFA-related protein